MTSAQRRKLLRARRHSLAGLVVAQPKGGSVVIGELANPLAETDCKCARKRELRDRRQASLQRQQRAFRCAALDWFRKEQATNTAA